MTKSTKPEPLTPLQWEMAVGYGSPDRQDEFPLRPTMKAATQPEPVTVERPSKPRRPDRLSEERWSKEIGWGKPDYK